MTKDWLNEVLEKVKNGGVDAAQEIGGLEPWDILSPAQAHKLISAQLIRERIDEIKLAEERHEIFETDAIDRLDDLTNKLKELEDEKI